MRATLLASLLGMALSQRALAESPNAQAKAHFDQGAVFFAAKDYEAAISAFEAGYALDPRPEILFAWAQAARLSGDCPSAIVLYERFLAGQPPARQARAARANRELCKQALATRPEGV